MKANDDKKFYFNLQALFDKSFKLGVDVLKPVIFVIHSACAKTQNLLDEKALTEFYHKNYGI